MLRVTAVAATALVVLAAGALAAGALAPAQENAASRAATAADLERWQTELSNWGRWGSDDEIGTINLITPEKRRAAAGLVRAGVSVSLARDVLKEEAVDNPRPFEHTMHGVGSDTFAVRYHGWAHTHLDALAHVDDDEGRMYNGYVPDEAAVLAAGGHARNSIHNLKNGIFTRGILMDIPRLKGVPYWSPRRRSTSTTWKPGKRGPACAPARAMPSSSAPAAGRPAKCSGRSSSAASGPRPACTRRSSRGCGSAMSRCSAATVH